MSWPSGKVLWRVPNNRGRDVQALPNGHLLMTLDLTRRVVELDQDHRTVWTYGAAEGLELPTAAQRLENGNTVIGDPSAAGSSKSIRPARLFGATRALISETCACEIAAARPRGRRSSLWKAAGKVIEVDRAGQVVWTYVRGECRQSFPLSGASLDERQYPHWSGQSWRTGGSG